jgi:diguanylate cyclase (GGDEF)-like protein
MGSLPDIMATTPLPAKMRGAPNPSVSSKCSLLVVDDDPANLQALAKLAQNEFEVSLAGTAEAAQHIFQQRDVDLILTDQRLCGCTGIQLLEWVRLHSPHTIRLIITGLARLEDAVDAINCGQVYRYLFKPWRSDELLQILRNAARTFLLERSHEQLLDELRQLNLELENRVQLRTHELEDANRQLQQKNSMLEKLALTDALTGLPNRRAMDRLVRSELKRRTRYPGPLTLGLIDADHFKDINSRYLLTGGDQVLVTMARTLVKSIRSVDNIARIGGEEFMIVAPETSGEGAAVLAERIRSSVERSRTQYQNQAIAVTVSVGFAVAEPLVEATYEQMKHVAAAALEEAKATGRNRCVIRSVPRPLVEQES